MSEQVIDQHHVRGPDIASIAHERANGAAKVFELAYQFLRRLRLNEIAALVTFSLSS